MLLDIIVIAAQTPPFPLIFPFSLPNPFLTLPFSMCLAHSEKEQEIKSSYPSSFN